MNRLFAEAFGTFSLVLAGTGAITVNEVSGGIVTHVGVALTFGLVTMAMIYAVGDISGAHLNPAVTLGFWASGRFPARAVPAYVASQLVGAFAASVFLRLLYPEHSTLGTTLPSHSAGQALAIETVLTLLLMFVILNVSKGGRETGVMAGAAIGAVVALEAMFAGPVSGASMNPARSIAPAFVSGHLQHCWVYVLGPFAGALAAVVACRCTRPAGCCNCFTETSSTCHCLAE